MTKQRQVVLDIINNSTKHLTADEIYFLAKQQISTIAVGTVYRNLNILSEENLIVKIDIPERSAVYDRANGMHEHLICSVCGCIQDVDINKLQEYLQQYVEPCIENFSLTMYYTCDNCKKIKILQNK